MAYLPLSTANLPDPVIDPAQGASPEDYFNTVLYTGTGSTRSVSGVGHQPDFLWLKSRSQATVHVLYDVLRGGTNALRSNTTDAEAQYADGVITFEADGFEIAGSSVGGINGSGESMVAWNWKANGSGVSNTDGSITSTVSANTTSGFSIVSYTGTGSAATVGHGLDSAPEMIIVKSRNDTDNWLVYHIGNTYSGSPENSKLRLNTTGDGSGGGTPAIYWNSTAPTSSVFSVGTNGDVNQSSELYISYCFHSVEGFSKFGSYVGNGSADGPFVYTGFRPAFVMMKDANSGTSQWLMMDDTRDIDNPVTKKLSANISDAENSTSVGNDTQNLVDFLSNGFKLKTSNGNSNASGGNFIFMCFSSNPFKYSNAR